MSCHIISHIIYNIISSHIIYHITLQYITSHHIKDAYTCTRFIVLPVCTLKLESCHDANVLSSLVTLRGHQWRQSWHHDNSRFSVHAVPSLWHSAVVFSKAYHKGMVLNPCILWAQRAARQARPLSFADSPSMGDHKPGNSGPEINICHRIGYWETRGPTWTRGIKRTLEEWSYNRGEKVCDSADPLYYTTMA